MNQTPEEFEDKDLVETAGIPSNQGEFVEDNLYDLVGGKEFFKTLCSKFYEGVAQDEILRPMYPEGDLAPAAERLQMFLEQYWGGPKTYQEQRGHPRLRLRHQQFKINPAARAAWVKHMRAALDAQQLPAIYDEQMWGYLDSAATAMLNTFED
ncbi:MAG: globin [Rhodoluna sp.]|jgi:hemoglobin|nr:globin [Rhodoluna sp.]